MLWDLNHTAFIDVAGLHLLFAPAPHHSPHRRTTVTGLRPQPLRLLLLAADMNPAVFDLGRLLAEGTPPSLSMMSGKCAAP
ncbi:hypothetical protein [Streptomyces collinus]|uniref:hypothetical protein n=1 Tax=Streptomyces collinus TaxID=42684 RepID=UPI00362D80CF